MMKKNSGAYPHVVIVGGGFAGLTLAKSLRKYCFRVTLLDKHNYHQFPPLFYQVAAAQIEPSAILFPFRKEIRPYPKQCFIMTEVESVDIAHNTLQTNHGHITFDYLVLATGSDTNFFGMDRLQKFAYPMKSVSEALALRNHILEILEEAKTYTDTEKRKQQLSVVIVGGGPTGVEIAGVLGELKHFILPHEYPELAASELSITLIEGSDKLLSAMSDKSFIKAAEYLHKLDVEVILGKHVTDYDGSTVYLNDGNTLLSQTVIWSSGITGKLLKGLDQPDLLAKGNRIKVDAFNRINGFEHIFALGDVCLQTEKKYPNGHPQIAPVAIQQAKQLGENLGRLQTGKNLKNFHYKHKGSMAIVGKKKAVADLHQWHLNGFLAWISWLVIHLISIMGFKNKLFVMLDWAYAYFFNDASLRLIIRPKEKRSS